MKIELQGRLQRMGGGGIGCVMENGDLISAGGDVTQKERGFCWLCHALGGYTKYSNAADIEKNPVKFRVTIETIEDHKEVT